MQRALVIEETPDLAGFVAAIFEHLNFETHVVETFERFIFFLTAYDDIGAVFISVNGEVDFDAPDLAKRVRTLRPGVELFVASGRIDRLDEYPRCVFFGKPVNASLLISMLQKIVGSGSTGNDDIDLPRENGRIH